MQWRALLCEMVKKLGMLQMLPPVICAHGLVGPLLDAAQTMRCRLFPWQIVGLYDGCRTAEEGEFYGVASFAHIAWPVIVHQ